MFQAVSESNLSSRSLIASVNAQTNVGLWPKTPFLTSTHIFNTGLNRNFEDSYIQVFGQVRDFGKVRVVVGSQ
jgi:hypothetical protein